MEQNMQQLTIGKELNSNDKIYKPDFNSKSGRELLAFYLQTKFRQIFLYDKKQETPIINQVNPDFIDKFSRRLINKPAKRLLIGVTGESASGKSTICHEIKNVIEQLSMPVTVLSTDNYFNDISALINKYGSFDNLTDNGYDVDAPTSFQLDILRSDLEDLSDGLDIKAPMYLPNGTGVSVPKAFDVKAQKIIVVEGIATMYESVKDVFDIKIYVETENDLRKSRFMSRAVEERNQSVENAEKHWSYIAEAGEKYVKPFRKDADLVINGNSNLKYFAQILEYIHEITNNFQG
ncbi:AAA family ATPase [bacterium]|nr:AAA family ATPase [bacterium]